MIRKQPYEILMNRIFFLENLIQITPDSELGKYEMQIRLDELYKLRVALE